MYIVEREEKEPWLASRFALLLELGYGFTVGLIGNAAAIICSLFWFLPHIMGNGFFLFLVFFNLVVFLVLGILQIIGFVYCLIDLSRRSTYQSWLRVGLVAIGLVLNCLPVTVYVLITGPQGNGVGA